MTTASHLADQRGLTVRISYADRSATVYPGPGMTEDEVLRRAERFVPAHAELVGEPAGTYQFADPADPKGDEDDVYPKGD